MTRFADELYDDLMRDHGRALADTRPPAARRPLASHRVALTAGLGGVAVAATAGSLVVLSGSPAYALTTNQDGTQTLAVYQRAGIAQANAKFHRLGEPVVVVPVRAGCPSISSLPKPAVPGKATRISVKGGRSADGSITVDAHGIPAGDILVLGVQTTAHGSQTGGGLTSGPAPSCVSLPQPPAPGGSGHQTSG
ncbi:MAG TPA: hypothetical protein VIZ20_17620 [Streptosporangiaceae bacterium]